MLELRIEQKGKPSVYRVLHIEEDMDLFDLDTAITVTFMMEHIDESLFHSVRLNGEPNDVRVSVSDDEDDLDLLDFTAGDWFSAVGDEMHYVTAGGLRLVMTLVRFVQGDGEAALVAGEGDLFSKRKKIPVAELNVVLQQQLALERALFTDMMEEVLAPDFSELLMLADTLKKLKPWLYFENGDILALQVEDMHYYVSVMGAAGQEYGLMIYDEQYGYASLEKILKGGRLPKDFSFHMSALTVNYVDRDELDKDDYALIKEHGWSFRGKKQWIVFRSYDPGLEPALPDYSQVLVLEAILRALISITHERMNGWTYPTVASNQFPLFKVDEKLTFRGILEVESLKQGQIAIELNELEAAKLKKKKKVGPAVEWDYSYLPFPVSEHGERAIYPVLFLVVDRATGIVLDNEILPVPNLPEIQQQVFWQVMQELDTLPSSIYVTKETEFILQPLAKKIGVKLVASELPMISEVKDMMLSTPPF